MYSEKLETLAMYEGYPNSEDMLLDIGFDSVVPGICMREDCDGTTEVEPDSKHGWCPVCGKNTVASALVCAGIM